MIVVTVKLESAISRDRDRELMRMTICNDGTVTDTRRGDYVARLFRKGSDSEVIRMGRVEDFPKQSYHVGRLVLRALVKLFPEEQTMFQKGHRT